MCYQGRLNVSKLLQKCREEHMWSEVVFLHIIAAEMSQAVSVMIEHSSVAWTEAQFQQAIAKVTNQDVLFEALEFYLLEHPLLINTLLSVVEKRIDHTKVVKMFQRTSNLPLIREFLKSAQKINGRQVGDAYNELLIQECDWTSLRSSVEKYGVFETFELAQKLEQMQNIEARRIATIVYRQSKRWEKAIECSMRDCLWLDAIDAAWESQDPKLVMELSDNFVENNMPEEWASLLFACYEWCDVDQVMAQGFMNGMSDWSTPFMCQKMKDFNQIILKLSKLVE